MMGAGSGGSGRRRRERDDYQELLDDARADDAARSRVAERWLRQRAEEGAAFGGVLLDLAERGSTVTVRTVAGGSHQGRVAGVARDFVALRTAGGQTVYLRLDAVALVRPEPHVHHPTASAERATHHDRTLAEQLARLAAERPRVALIATADREPITGELRGVGADVATIRSGGGPGDVVYVRTDAVVEATVLHG